MPSHLSDAALYLAAEQILLQECVRTDFNDLHEDDQAKLDAIISRGLPVFAPEALLPGESTSLLAARIAPSLFSLEGIISEPASRLRKFMEEVTRYIRPVELLPSLAGEYYSTLAQHISPKLVQEIRERSTAETAPLIPLYGVQLATVHFSVIAAFFFAGETHSLLSSRAQEYVQKLQHAMDCYCQNFLKKLGILDLLLQMTPEQWKFLSGLTPRIEMAQIAPALEQNFVDQLLTPLPTAQQNETKQLIILNKQEALQDFSSYDQRMRSIKQWLLTIQKVPNLQGQ